VVVELKAARFKPKHLGAVAWIDLFSDETAALSAVIATGSAARRIMTRSAFLVCGSENDHVVR